MLRAHSWRLTRLFRNSLKDYSSSSLRAQYFCSNVSLSIERLSNRSIVRVAGSDAANYLQGLITNDMRHLNEDSPTIKEASVRCPPKAMYCMFLDARGRILLDSIIYRAWVANKDDELTDVYLLECDSEIASTLFKHLKLYKLRKKVDISLLTDEMDVWVEFSSDPGTAQKIDSNFTGKKNQSGIIVCRDPRLPALGVRVLCPKGSCNLKSENLKGLEAVHYRAHRYELGVGEGIHDLPPGNSFPLEANCDYLHGVSFHKGCYVGQELTARTHHTGVIRKRLMPLKFSNVVHNSVAASEVSVTDVATGKSVGKVRGIAECQEKSVGLGLLRVAEVLKASSLKVDESDVKTERPFWWPEEAPKGLKPKGSS